MGHLPTLNQYAASYDVYPSNGHNQKHSPSVTPKTKPMQYSKSHHNGSANHRQFNKYPHPEMRQMNGNNVKQPNFNRRRRSVSMDDYEFEQATVYIPQHSEQKRHQKHRNGYGPQNVYNQNGNGHIPQPITIHNNQHYGYSPNHKMRGNSNLPFISNSHSAH